MGSKRLPGKVLLPLNGHTVIGEVLSRCKRIPGVDHVVCAIPDTKDNDILASIQQPPSLVFGLEGQAIYRGSEDDVFGRYCAAANASKADIIVRVTGDCPLISPDLCGEVLRKLKDKGADYASNIEPRTFPQGMDCEAFTYKALSLRWAARLTSGMDAEEREHVTMGMRRSSVIKRVNVWSPWKLEGRLTLDTEDDYRVICAYFGHEPHQHLRAA